MINLHGVKAIYRFELARWFRTLMQSILAPVISTSLYFVVFGSAIGSKMTTIDGVSYGAFIVPGLIMLSILTEPQFFKGDLGYLQAVRDKHPKALLLGFRVIL